MEIKRGTLVIVLDSPYTAAYSEKKCRLDRLGVVKEAPEDQKKLIVADFKGESLVKRENVIPIAQLKTVVSGQQQIREEFLRRIPEVIIILARRQRELASRLVELEQRLARFISRFTGLSQNES